VRAGDWWVYLVELENGSWYTGISTDPRRRFQQHLKGSGAKSMRLSAPKRLLSLEFIGPYASAARREAQIKGLTRKKKEAYAADPPSLDPPASDADFIHRKPRAKKKR
jgi:putative endonuclease